MVAMEAEILHILNYFHFFSYPPSESEIYTYLRRKVSLLRLSKQLTHLLKQEKIREKLVQNQIRYTIEGYSSDFKKYTVRTVYSKNKLQKIKLLIFLLSLIPTIQFVGVSGSVAMENAKERDDIDFFIITTPRRLWTGRLWSLLCTEFLGIRRRWGEVPGTNKACLNLFFDAECLSVPKHKQTEYVAHEILQVRPVIDKNNTYIRFLQANRWVFRMFPNAIDTVGYGFLARVHPKLSKKGVLRQVGDIFERFAERLQKYSIRKHQTTELITQTQLWFHPKDFGKRFKNSGGEGGI